MPRTFAEVLVGSLIGCGGILIAFVALLVVCAVTLWASVWIANKCLGKSDEYDRPAPSGGEWDNDDRPERRRGTAIPEPSFAHVMAISFLVVFASVVVDVVIALALGAGVGAAGGNGNNNRFIPQGGELAVLLLAVCVDLVTGFLIWSGALTVLLPTSFGRAVLVTVFVHLMQVAIGTVAVLCAFAVTGLVGAGAR